MRIALVIQARMGSTRLPGKVLLPLAGAPLLARMVERVRAVRTPHALCVATTWNDGDEPIVELCRDLGVDCFRGHPTDLLDRHYRAGEWLGADVVVKVPSDCPLIDPSVIDQVLGAFLADQGRADFVTNLHPPSYPDGNDVELMRFEALRTAWQEATRPFEREHTTPFIWERPDRFFIRNVRWETGLDYSRTHRFTIDYPEDYAFISAVFDALYPVVPRFGLRAILGLLEMRPEIRQLNARRAGQSWHHAHLSELNTVSLRGDRLHFAEQERGTLPRG